MKSTNEGKKCSSDHRKEWKKGKKGAKYGKKRNISKRSSPESRRQGNTRPMLKSFWLKQQRRKKRERIKQMKLRPSFNLKFRGRSRLLTEPSQLLHQLRRAKSNSRMLWDLFFKARINPNEITIQFQISIPNSILQV